MKFIRMTVTAILCFLAAGSHAESYRSVVVSLSDGSNTRINLTGTLETAFDESQVIFTDGETQIRFDKALMESFTFDEASDGVSAITGENTTPVVGNGVIEFSGLPDGSRIRLYDLGGKCLLDEAASGNYKMEIPAQTRGVYIVNVNNMSYKITLK